MPVLTDGDQSDRRLAGQLPDFARQGKKWSASCRVWPKADTIYLATDLDREGEAIAWHLREIIGGDDSRYKRVVFNEITKTAIQEAFAQPSELNIHRVNAQQARRFLDRVVGHGLPAAVEEAGPRPLRRSGTVRRGASHRR